MKTLTVLLTLAFLLICGTGRESLLMAADCQNCCKGCTADCKGMYWAPSLKVTNIYDQSAYMAGFRGGWITSPSMRIGLCGYGVINEIDGSPNVWPTEGLFDIEMFIGGVECEYFMKCCSGFDYGFYLLAGGGAAKYVKDGSSGSEQQGETDFTLLMEPGITGELKIYKRLYLNTSLTYRIVTFVDMWELDNSDFGGVTFNLSLKIVNCK